MSRLKEHYPIMYTNENGRCAHEFILDCRGFKDSCGVEAIDIVDGQTGGIEAINVIQPSVQVVDIVEPRHGVQFTRCVAPCIEETQA